MPPSHGQGSDGFTSRPPSAYGHRSHPPSRPRNSYDGAPRPRYTPSPLSASGGASDKRRFSADQYGSRPMLKSPSWQGRSATPATTENDFYEERRLGDMAGDSAHFQGAMDSVSIVHESPQPSPAFGYRQDPASPFLPQYSGAGYGQSYSLDQGGMPLAGPPTSYSWPAPPLSPGELVYPSSNSEPGQLYKQYSNSAQMYADPYAQDQEYYYQPPPPPPGRPQSVASSSALTLAHPPSLYPASPATEAPPSIFGIQADHHAWTAGGSPHSRPNRDHLPNFPSWSRTWYDGHVSADGHAYTAVPPHSGASGWESETLTRSGRSPYPQYGPGYLRGHRDSADFVKQERVRMLEKKFGKPKVTHRSGDAGDASEEAKFDPDADLPAGVVTSKGSIKMHWPKTYLTLKVLLVLVSSVAFIMALLAVLMIKPTPESTPAIKSSPISWALHVASLLSFLLMLWLFLLRPCCCDSGRSAARHGGAGLEGPGGTAGGFGGMVIPVMGSQGGPQMSKRGFFGRKRQGGTLDPAQMGTTVNLIVDPSVLGGALGGSAGKKKRRKKYDEEEDDEDDDESEYASDDDADDIPGAYRARRRRTNPLESLKQRRLQAVAVTSLRKKLTYLTLFSIVLLAALIALFAFSSGKATTCKSQGSSWCLCWSVELACNILVEIALVCILVLGWWGYRKARRATGRNGPGGAHGFA